MEANKRAQLAEAAIEPKNVGSLAPRLVEITADTLKRCGSCCNYEAERAHSIDDQGVQIHCQAWRLRKQGSAMTPVVEWSEDCEFYNKETPSFRR